jgi:hypothetical protein
MINYPIQTGLFYQQLLVPNSSNRHHRPNTLAGKADSKLIPPQ